MNELKNIEITFIKVTNVEKGYAEISITLEDNCVVLCARVYANNVKYFNCDNNNKEIIEHIVKTVQLEIMLRIQKELNPGKTESVYSQIKNNYCFKEEDGFLCINVWATCIASDEAKVIAKVFKNRIIFIDEKAKNDKYALKMIKEAKKYIGFESSIYKELRNDYFDEVDSCILIDSYITDDDNEEGNVIAKVFNDKVVYLDPRAEFDFYALEIIEEAKGLVKVNQPCSYVN